jgi:hypothetical protein
MSTLPLLEAAVRSLVMGAIILLALRLLRIEQVRARRTAWLLALVGALAMPVLVAEQIGPRLLPELAPVKSPAAHPQTIREASGGDRGRLTGSPAGLPQDIVAFDPRTLAIGADRGEAAGNAMLSAAVFGYCVVAALLSLRLCAGVGFAVRVRNQAERLIFPFDPELDVRASARVASPVTIGSSVLLPENYLSWDEATLRIVLSHERAHVRQKDFFIQALAGVHCALFWFNPFSWWLQRQLSELGEALSDCAAVGQAESRTRYAEILLAFASRSHSPLAAVAMASASNLSPRIERLLSDRSFERSFAPRQRLPFIAAGVVALAMFASTSMVRATDTAAPNPPAAPNTPAALNPPAAPDTPAAPNPPAAPNAPAMPATIKAPAAAATDARPAKKPVRVRKLSNRDFNTVAEAGNEDTVVEHDDATKDEEGVLVINSGQSRMMFNAGNRLPSQSGDYIYFQHNGKPYLIQDPQIIEKAQTLLAPMQALQEKQRLLGAQQSVLGAQQRLLGSQQRAIKLAESPEFKQQMAELQKTIKELDLPRLTAQIDQRALAELQAHLGDIQAQVGRLQSEFDSQQGRFGEEQGRLGEQQGKLGEQQSKLGEQQRKIAEEVRRRLKPIIEQAIQEGKGKALAQ